MAAIDGLCKLLRDQKGSDLHLASGSIPILRIHGNLERLTYPPLKVQEIQSWLYEIMPEEKMKIFEETGDVDFSHEASGIGRFRVNVFRHVRGIGTVWRYIPQNLPHWEQLGLPNSIKRFCNVEKGLILITGPTGSGKSTTLASLMDYINENQKSHLITIEDPLEFVHHSKMSHVTHRELGSHTQTFSAALRSALREDPDIIMLGEMRDLETISLALEAATTGHLVFSTLHTSSAAKTIDRIIDVFPSEEQNKIRMTLSEVLKGIVAQTLVPRVGGGRIAALEILYGTSAVASLIREGKTHQISAFMQAQKKSGMMNLDDHLMDLLSQKIITPKTAYEHAISKENFLSFLENKEKDQDFFLS